MTRLNYHWEDNYIGAWVGEPLRELHIQKIEHQTYLATLLIQGQPIKRPWFNNELSIDMPVTYSSSAFDESDFSIDLWSDGRFAISLEYEPGFQIYNDPPCEALTMGITRLAELNFLDQYYDLLGGLEHFVRA